MTLRGIDHVQLAMPTGGEDAARHFYGELLGEIVDDEPLDGYQRVYTYDPFGNRLELLEPTEN